MQWNEEFAAESAYSHEGLQNHAAFTDLPLQSWPRQIHLHENAPALHIVSDDYFEGSKDRYRLGENYLPIAPYREYILDTVDNNQAVVLSSETGSGKSSQLGLYLLEAGYPRVFVSSPRILAARELKERAQYNLGLDHAHLAGYLTGNASDSDCAPNARLIYVTEQLLFKMVNRGQLRPDDVVINDEAHERTAGTIMLLGLMKEQLRDNPDMKLLISSATIDTEKFARYLGDKQAGKSAPTLVLPGRTYPIEERESDLPVAVEARNAIKDGRSVLVFEPGLDRMSNTWMRIGAWKGSDTVVHELYGDLSPREQKEALNPDSNHHLIATRIGETSITPEGKDTVIDSGLSNIGGYDQGLHILETVFSSRATMEQRKGRVGRTSPGLYISAVPDKTPPPPSLDERDAYERPEIQRSSVASYVAELQAAGRRLEDLDLLESPTSENLRYDYTFLCRIGAITLEDEVEVLTDIGRAMTDLPLNTDLARMVVEARRMAESDKIDGEALRLQVAAAAAIQQVQGIVNSWKYSKARYLSSQAHEEQLSKEVRSDLIFELDAFTKMFIKHQAMLAEGRDDFEERFEAMLNKKDIFPNRYYKALRTFEELCRREGLDVYALRIAEPDERKAITGCQITGARELFVQRTKNNYYDIRGDWSRQLGRRSTIAPNLGGLVIGTAFNLSGFRANGRYTRRFIKSGSAVTREQLIKHAGERITTAHRGFGVTLEGDLVEKQALYFDGTLMFDDDTWTAPAATRESREFILRAMMTGEVPSHKDPRTMVPYDPKTPRARMAIAQLKRAKELEDRSPIALRISERHAKLLNAVIRESLEIMPLDVTNPHELDAVIPRVYVNSLVRPTRRKNVGAILAAALDGISLQVDDERKEYVGVHYKDGVAYVTIDRDMQYTIRREDFAELESHYPVRVRVEGRKSLPIEAAFKRMEELRNSPARLRRLARRAENAAKEPSPNGVEPEWTPISRRAIKHSEMAPKLSTVAMTIKNGSRRPLKKKRETRVKEIKNVVVR